MAVGRSWIAATLLALTVMPMPAQQDWYPVDEAEGTLVLRMAGMPA